MAIIYSKNERVLFEGDNYVVTYIDENEECYFLRSLYYNFKNMDARVKIGTYYIDNISGIYEREVHNDKALAILSYDKSGRNMEPVVKILFDLKTCQFIPRPQLSMYKKLFANEESKKYIKK